MIQWRASVTLLFEFFRSDSSPSKSCSGFTLFTVFWESAGCCIVMTCLVLLNHSRPPLVPHHYDIAANTMVAQHSHWVLHHIILTLLRTQMLEHSTSLFWTHIVIVLTASRSICQCSEFEAVVTVAGTWRWYFAQRSQHSLHYETGEVFWCSVALCGVCWRCGAGRWGVTMYVLNTC